VINAALSIAPEDDAALQRAKADAIMHRASQANNRIDIEIGRLLAALSGHAIQDEAGAVETALQHRRARRSE